MSDHEGREITEQESPDKIIKVWQIEPHISSQYDYCAVREYERAVHIAKKTIEYLMDAFDPTCEECITIKIKLVEMRLCDYEEIIQNTD